MIIVKSTLNKMVSMVTSKVQKYHIYIFLTTKRYKLKVSKFEGLSSSRSGDVEENYRGGHNAPHTEY